ncbi:glycosyltransferase [Microbacterium sp. dk485]|nr:glycosyltransferase [Microbacterium sp. dk485]
MSSPTSAHEPKPRVFVFLRHGLGETAWESMREAGVAWEESPYGYGRAAKWFDLHWSRDRQDSRTGRFARRALRRVLGFDLMHAWHNRRAIYEADAVWTHTEFEHLAVAALKALRLSRPSFVTLAQTVWLWDSWGSYSRLRRALLARLLRRHDKELVLSRANHMVSVAAVPNRVVSIVPFGTELPTVKRIGRQDRRPVVVAVGNDKHRDWATLAAAARQMEDVDFIVHSSAAAALNVRWPRNVDLRRHSVTTDVLASYAEANVAVVPLVENLHASGITVAMEAMASGVPLVASDTGGISDYVSGPGCLLTPPGDAHELARSIGDALSTEVQDASPELRARLFERGLSQEQYVWRLVWCTLDLLHAAKLPPEVHDFRHVPPPRPS